MAFDVLVSPAVTARIASWGLDPAVTREFYLRLVDQLGASTAVNAVTMTERGMEYTTDVEESSRVHFVFVALLRRTDVMFQVVDCSCARIEDSRITWRSPRTDEN